jgi:UDP-glucose 4-epimerase
MKILITGVGGFIGAHVARRFLAEGNDVIGVDDFSSGRRSNVPKGVSLVEGDLSQLETISKLPKECDLILHLAGQSSGEISFDDPVADLQKNTVTTLRLIRYGLDQGVSRIVYASSMSVYGNQPDQPIAEQAECKPLSCYGVGKLAAEGYLRIYSDRLPYVCMRMFNVYGPGQDLQNMRQGMVSIFLAQALEQGKIHVKGSLERYRDFIYIDDVVEAWYRAATSSKVSNLTLNLGTGNKVTLLTLLETLRKHLPGTEWYNQGGTPGDQHGIYADNTMLRDELGMNHLVSLDDGLKRFVDWAKSSRN